MHGAVWQEEEGGGAWKWGTRECASECECWGLLALCVHLKVGDAWC